MSKNQEKRPNRAEFQRTQSLRLPTPPPDPQTTQKATTTTTMPDKTNDQTEDQCKMTEKESNDFFEYLNSLPTTNKTQQNDKPSLQRSGSIFAPIMATEDAFDHLDKLYKLMEQLLNLREQNAKLQRRVRDLEHLRNLQNLDTLVTNRVLRGEESEIPDLDDDTIVAEALLDNMFNKTNKKYKSPTQFKFRQSILRPQRDRSTSVAFDGSMDPLSPPVSTSIPRNMSGKSLPERGILRKSSKVSKWTKVKAAFKWEKASPTVTGAKSQDSGIGGMLPINNEVARYLRVPSTCDNPTEAGTSPADSVLSGSWNAVHGLSTPGTISPASSTDDLNPSAISEHRSVSRTDSGGNATCSNRQFRASKTSDEEDGERRSRSLDYTGNCSCDSTQGISKDDLLKLQISKSHKTPWGKVKDIIQTRKDSLKKKQHRLSARSDDYRNTDYSAGSDQEDVFEAATHSSNHDTPTVMVTNSEEDTTPKMKSEQNIPADVVARYQKVANEEEKSQPKSSNGSPRVQRRISKWTKVKKAFLTSASSSRNDDDSKSMPSSPTNKNCHFFSEMPTQNWKSFDDEKCLQNKNIPENDLETRKLKEEIHKNYEQLQKKLSQEFQEKLHEWEKVKSSINSGATSLGGSQTVSTCPPTSDEQRDPEFLKKMEEWQKIKNQNTAEINKRRNIQMTSEENLPADFKKKLQEWQRIKKFGGREEEPSTSKSIKKKNEWQLWRSNSSTKQDNNLSLAQTDSRQYSEDFLKKLDEWKQMKSSNATYEDQNEHRKSLKENKTPSPNLARKCSGTKLIRQNKNHKMQEWLEKELQKIEREKQRLEREREKFLEREERLAKLRRSIGNTPHKKDVLVQTSTGFYRFEGISRKFTQRLYEWEKARGIGPEASTFALLNSGYHQISPNPMTENQAASYRREQMPRIKLTRSKSMDSVANLACGGPSITHQPSSLSLNDVEELEMQCLEESQSERNLNESEDNLDYGEPEAVIVEVEDFVEETAAPLEAIVSNDHHTPVYQTQTIKLCESGKCETPQVRRSNSTTALSNYNIIQESLSILNKMKDTEEACKIAEAKMFEPETNEEIGKYTGAIPKKQNKLKSKRIFNASLQDCLSIYYEQQTEIGQGLVNKISILNDSNAAKYTSNENTVYTISQPTDTLIFTEKISTELIFLAEKLKQLFYERKLGFYSTEKELNFSSYNKYGLDISEIIEELILKIQELRRSLSYVCAANESTAPGRSRKGSKKERKLNRSSLEQISSTNEKTTNNDNTSDEEDQKPEKIKPPRRKEKLVKSKSEDNQMINYAKLQVTSFVDQKKERTERCYQLNSSSKSQVHLNTKSLDSNENTENKLCDVETFKKNKCQRKLTRSRRVSESCSDTIKNEEDTLNVKTSENQAQVEMLQNLSSNVIIPTHIQYLDATSVNPNANDNTSASSSPVSVFVQTTRKMFTPFVSEVFDTGIKNSTNNDTQKKENERENSNESTKSKVLRRSHSPSESPMLPRKKRMTINENDGIDQKQPEEENTEHLINDNQNSQSRPSTPSHLPPLPSSPIIQRRERHLSKETSPAIRMMIARYNQKLSEQETSGNKSAGSSGSASPVAWRSPVFERRVKAQTEKYQEEVNKSFVNKSSYSPLFMRKQVQKSASVGVIGPVKKQVTSPEITQRGSSLDSSEKNASPKLIRGILKSTSVGSMKTNTVSESQENVIASLTEEIPTINEEKSPATTLKLSIPPPQPSSTKLQSSNFQERAHKLQKAKEEFLSQKTDSPSTSAGPSSAAFDFENQEKYSIKYPSRNRLSQVSCGSESSFDDINSSSGLLIKSASAGMINVDEATYEQFRPEMHSQGYVSLPRATKKKDGKFGISSLASKFRKVKMRRIKDPTQMNTVSTLCRQSLVVDITGNSKENIDENNEEKKSKKKNSKDSSSSDLHSPSTSSSSKTSWIKNTTKIFKTKDSK